MKWVLIVTALNMEGVYPDADTCAAAAFAIENKTEHIAVCIPKPESELYRADDQAIFLYKFMEIIKQFRNNNELPQ